MARAPLAPTAVASWSSLATPGGLLHLEAPTPRTSDPNISELVNAQAPLLNEYLAPPNSFLRVANVKRPATALVTDLKCETCGKTNSPHCLQFYLSASGMASADGVPLIN